MQDLSHNQPDHPNKELMLWLISMPGCKTANRGRLAGYLHVTVEVIKKSEIRLLETIKEAAEKRCKRKENVFFYAYFCYKQSTASAVCMRFQLCLQMWVTWREVWRVLPWVCLPCWSWVHRPLWHEMCKVPLLPCQKLQRHTHARTRSHAGRVRPLLMPLWGRGEVCTGEKWVE